MIEITVFGMVFDGEGSTIAEDADPDFYDILVIERDGEGNLLQEPIEEIEDLTWEQAQQAAASLERKYEVEADYVGCD